MLVLVILFVSLLVAQGKWLRSLQSGKWVKYISGASNNDVCLVRNLALVYSLAGVNCIGEYNRFFIFSFTKHFATEIFDIRNNRLCG